jgi:hypothetical protein
VDNFRLKPTMRSQLFSSNVLNLHGAVTRLDANSRSVFGQPILM